MRNRITSRSRLQPTLPFALLLILLGVLWFAGGASRADALGQVIVRGASGIALVILSLIGARPGVGTARPVLLFIVAMMALALLQLVPLPPALWQSLPGHAVFAEAAAASGQPQPWRPWSLVPGATVNAAASLIVPLATAMLIAGMAKSEREWLSTIVLGFVTATMLIGLLQFSRAGLSNPLVGGTRGEVCGNFANRNHFALLLAMGCALAPVWGFSREPGPGWRGPVALGLVLLFLLTILASGSRAGFVFGVLGLIAGLLAVRKQIRRALRGRSRWVIPAIGGGVAGLVGLIVLMSVAAGRAVSIDRVLSTDLGNDMRALSLPTILRMIHIYFPTGSGLGSFDPVFRLHEPFALLKPTYFNHAHNDWLEVALDAGLFGVLLLLAAVIWWARASLHVWKGRGPDYVLPRLGSALLFLVMGASIFDYPARTPVVMAVTAIAALWLAQGSVRGRSFALPDEGGRL